MKNKQILGLSAAVLTLASSAYAVQTIDAIRWSTDGVTWNVANQVNDGGAGDASAVNGFISTSISINGWNLQLVGSSTYPNLGTQAAPQMDLAIQGTSGTGSLYIEFSVQDFQPVPAGSYITSVTGTDGAGVSNSETTRIGNTNGLFAPGISPGATFATVGPLTGSQSGSSSGIVPSVPGQPNPYTITIQQVLSASQTGSRVSTDISLEVPDGGNTLMMLGSALSVLGFGVFRKSRKA